MKKEGSSPSFFSIRTSAQILNHNIGSEMSEFLADHPHPFRPGKSKVEQFRHSVLRIAMPQSMRSGRPAEHFFAGFAKYEGEIDTTGEVVVLAIFDAPVDDNSRFTETSSFELFGQLARQPDFSDQATLANDRVGFTASSRKSFV